MANTEGIYDIDSNFQHVRHEVKHFWISFKFQALK